MCTFKDLFLLLWSLGSGYGIIFACESFAYECLGINLQLMFVLKGTVAVVAGFIIGSIHFHYTCPSNNSKNELDPNDSTNTLSPRRLTVSSVGQEGIDRGGSYTTRMCYVCNKNNVLSDKHTVCGDCYLIKKETEELQWNKKMRVIKNDNKSNLTYMQVGHGGTDDENDDDENDMLDEHHHQIVMETSFVGDRSM